MFSYLFSFIKISGVEWFVITLQFLSCTVLNVASILFCITVVFILIGCVDITCILALVLCLFQSLKSVYFISIGYMERHVYIAWRLCVILIPGMLRSTQHYCSINRRLFLCQLMKHKLAWAVGHTQKRAVVLKSSCSVPSFQKSYYDNANRLTLHELNICTVYLKNSWRNNPKEVQQNKIL